MPIVRICIARKRYIQYRAYPKTPQSSQPACFACDKLLSAHAHPHEGAGPVSIVISLST